MHLIYFVACDAVRLVKIGCTRDLQKRLDVLATTCPVRLELVGLIRGDFQDEEALHRRFAGHRSHGEWFRRCPEIDAAMVTGDTILQGMLASARAWDGLAGIRAPVPKAAGRPKGSKDSYRRTRRSKTIDDRYAAVTADARAKVMAIRVPDL